MIWVDPGPVEVPNEVREIVSGHALLAGALVRRGVRTREAALGFLQPAFYREGDPYDLAGLTTVVERLHRAIEQRERIWIWGHSGVDSLAATVLLVEALNARGADVASYVSGPRSSRRNRRADSATLADDRVRLVFACDFRGPGHSAAVAAAEAGVDLVSVHHGVPRPGHFSGLATVNPHFLSADHSMRHLSSVGLAYQIGRALRWDNLASALDLVALGTVAARVPLVDDARYLVQRGLCALRRSERHGLQAIFQSANLESCGLSEEHIEFVLAPRLSALGRLADAGGGVELLMTKDWTRARTLAGEAETLNARRQWLTKQVAEAALSHVERDPALLKEYDALVLSSPAWPGSVLGVVAGRLAERFGKPAVLITAPPGNQARGSARSIPGVDLLAAFADCAHLLQGHGGRSGAVGFHIQRERISELRAALSRSIARHKVTLPRQRLFLNGYVELSGLTTELVRAIRLLAPFGPGNAPVTLAVRDLKVVGETTVGRTGEHRRIAVQDVQECTQQVFWWHGAGWALPQGRFDLAVQVRASDYRGVPELQIQWVDAREHEPGSTRIAARPTIRVHDHRSAKDPLSILRLLADTPGCQVWAEVNPPPGVQTFDRGHLMPKPRLVIWTAPPGPRELAAVLMTAEPEEVFFFAQNPGLDEPVALLEKLAGMAKFALRKRGGQVPLEVAAAATAQRVSTVQAGLIWLAASGQLLLVLQGSDSWKVAAGNAQQNLEAADSARARLDALVAETAAYRAFTRSAPLETLTRMVWQPAT